MATTYAKISITPEAQKDLRAAIRRLSAVLDRDLTVSEAVSYMAGLALKFDVPAGPKGADGEHRA